MKEQLENLIRYITPFSTDDLKTVVDQFKPRQVSKGKMLLPKGEICREFYFVGKGCLRTYFIARNENEKTRYVMPSMSIGTALSSFIAQKPSFEYLDAVTDSDLLVIDHKDFYTLTENIPAWKNFYLKMLEMAYSFQNRRIESLTTLSAQQRYEQLLRENSSLVQILPNRMLASYLDMTQETLSRLKSK